MNDRPDLKRPGHPGPLAGIRILDLTSVVMGPYLTQILGDMGADVIKLEAPAGDTTRKITPMRNPDMGYMFLNLNRNKRSVVLDLKRPEAREAFRALAQTVDVVVSSVRPAALARLGISHERLALDNPRLISLSLVGFAQDGPYARYPVYEDLIQGLTAIPHLIQEGGADRPRYVPYAFNDRSVGLHAGMALLAALFARERSGVGQSIELPMFEAMAQGVIGEHLGGLCYEPAAGLPGYRRSMSKARRPYRTRDGYVCVIIYTDRHWQAFLDLIGRGGLMKSDPRLADIGTRTQHSDALYEMIEAEMGARTTGEWIEALRVADIPVAPLHTLESLFEDPHLRATGFLTMVEHPTEGGLRQPGVLGKWSATPLAVLRQAPQLGEHTREVLLEAGLGAANVDALIAAGAARQLGETARSNAEAGHA